MRIATVRLAALVLLLTGLAASSSAQVFTGRIEFAAVDSTGAVLPGVTVEISGPRAASQMTDARGEARFLGLPPGNYAVVASLQGFSEYRNENVVVVTGAAAPLRATLSVAGLAQQVEVTAEASPVIDPKAMTTSTNVTLDELQKVPSSRDPWVVLQTVPGVIVDRVNVGGAESGQQSNYQAKGAASGENTWNIDGVPITDMSALGSSPTYYDFDMFQEMQVTTGGADLTNATPGVALNFVLKGGTNTPHGSTRIYYENESMQSNNLPDELAATLGGVTGKGNRMDDYRDYGFELGGPIVRDRLWAWGAYGKTDVTLLTLANTPDQTILENLSFKGTGQISDAVRSTFTFFRGDKQKFGRGASPTRPPETTFNQSGPTSVYKGEGNFVVGSNLFLSARYAYITGGFALAPQGGLEPNWYIEDSGIYRGSVYSYETDRPQSNLAAEGNAFSGRHEIKFGFGWRRADTDSTTTVPGNAIVSYHNTYPNMIAEVTAWNHHTSTRGQYTHAYVGDTIAWDRLTLNAGLRWDRQAGSVKEFSQPGNPLLASLLPDLTGQAAKDAVVWNSVTPRVGISYALDDARRTLARASYGMFASQLNATAGGFLSTIATRGVYFYDVVDQNGNRFVDAAEIAGRQCTEALASSGECNFYGFDIDSPAAVSAPIHSVGDYKTPMTHEFQLGLDREVMPNFGISGTFTWRNFTNFVWRNNGLTGADYEQIDTFNGVPVYGVAPGRMPEDRAATIYREREGYSQRYVGFELAATKRLSNRWMARFGFSTNDHREYFDDVSAHGDPTPLIPINTGLTSANLGTGPNKDGGLVMRLSSGSGKSGIYQVLPKYQFVATGLYQAGWGLNFGANLVNRQGFSTPYFQSQVATADPNSRNKSVLLVDDVGENRLPAVTSLDARVGKEFAFDRFRLNVDLDVFNVLNANTVLGREYDRRLTTADQVREIMNPRVLRLGLRFNF
jgi:hypothetical protein